MPSIIRRVIKRPARSAKTQIRKKKPGEPQVGQVKDMAGLRRLADSFHDGRLKKASKAYIVHNGGRVRGKQGYKTGNQLKTCQHLDLDKDSFGFEYCVLPGLVDPDDPDDSDDFEDDPRIAISVVEGGELRIHGAYKDKKAAERVAKYWKPPRGVSAVSAVNVYLCADDVALPSKLFVVKGSIVGEGVGMYLLGVFSRKSFAESRAAQALCALPELYDGHGGMEADEMGDISEVVQRSDRTFQISIYRCYSEMVARATSEQVSLR